MRRLVTSSLIRIYTFWNSVLDFLTDNQYCNNGRVQIKEKKPPQTHTEESIANLRDERVKTNIYSLYNLIEV